VGSGLHTSITVMVTVTRMYVCIIMCMYVSLRDPYNLIHALLCGSADWSIN
jgi:hypothetical protein